MTLRKRSDISQSGVRNITPGGIREEVDVLRAARCEYCAINNVAEPLSDVGRRQGSIQ